MNLLKSTVLFGCVSVLYVNYIFWTLKKNFYISQFCFRKAVLTENDSKQLSLRKSESIFLISLAENMYSLWEY